MEQPYLTATLESSQGELDLSGVQSFSMDIVVTLHAPRAVTLYTADTLLSPSVTLRQGGIEFVHDGQLEPRNTIDVNHGHGPHRPWTGLLRLKPDLPTVISVPFGSPQRQQLSENSDLRLWMNTHSFKTGETYKATLPSGSKVSWWRYEYGIFGDVWFALESWWKRNQDVPVCPIEQQLTIHTKGDGVVFKCKGQSKEHFIKH